MACCLVSGSAWREGTWCFATRLRIARKRHGLWVLQTAPGNQPGVTDSPSWGGPLCPIAQARWGRRNACPVRVRSGSMKPTRADKLSVDRFVRGPIVVMTAHQLGHRENDFGLRCPASDFARNCLRVGDHTRTLEIARAGSGHSPCGPDPPNWRLINPPCRPIRLLHLTAGVQAHSSPPPATRLVQDMTISREIPGIAIPP